VRILLTGGAGFIASNFCHYWHEKYPKDKIVIIDKFSYAASWDNLYPLLDPYTDQINYDTFQNGQTTLWFLDLSVIRALPDYEFDFIINFAAETHVDNSISSPRPFVDNNVTGFFNLLEICRERQIKLYHISTDEVLQHHGPVPMTDRGKLFFFRIYEDTDYDDEGWTNPTYKPSSVYSATKAAQEMLVHAYRKTYDLDIDIIRLTNQYGPRQHREKLIPLVITKALAGEKIPVYKDGKQWRDWTYVEDSCEALDLITQQNQKNETWHIAANNETQNIDIIHTLLDKLGASRDLIEFVEDRKGHDQSYSLACTKVTNLGWKPKTSLSDGIDKTIAWYKE
jgi:dTDP-glucose 4,6-dehydratase